MFLSSNVVNIFSLTISKTKTKNYTLNILILMYFHPNKTKIQNEFNYMFDQNSLTVCGHAVESAVVIKQSSFLWWKQAFPDQSALV